MILGIITAFMLFAVAPTQVSASTERNAVSTTAPATTESAEANILLARLYEIKAMDLTRLKSAEKQQLRKEVRAIKGELKKDGGVYLSVGAIIIIILLLVLLLPL